MAGIVAKKVRKQKTSAVLKHYDEVPEVLPDGDLKFQKYYQRDYLTLLARCLLQRDVGSLIKDLNS